MMNRSFTGLTDTGVVRSVNQDNFYIDPGGRFFIVADGMGGHAGGEEASLIATREIQAYLETHWKSDIPSHILLEKAFLQANQGILTDQQDHPERGDMGTTALVVIFRDNKPWRAHIGDSRLYRFRDLYLEQITEDHTLVARALKMGEITREQAKTHPWRHVLFQCLGRKDVNLIEIAHLDVRAGDRLLLCSDGLTEEVSDKTIQQIFEQQKSCKIVAQNLVETAKEAGGSDNITVVIVVEGEKTERIEEDNLDTRVDKIGN
ncbi:Stp1/IreP family PP2C-type Ser/Thr phosphatase [cyanobacterium endosymbiont of Epithemia clementina EcSB]|uniref:Stp1/IreP family PP2C-type Ser/Thr phosphatase n=1 Tax=cyanobacterium endosymbiont of Epithemia clementina EcSB TaxID=3034674 RepID=UPI0024811544|nr:Stp1/IreP family PP2C-type Ser/Thr phosphatase [cyanobacterium endosymbiont of Epithemia clementina EcSB]WGT67733.1 Stp1/IreP family PP2C-type Ser/Thr phosphatase [cyanobacterium endosymbiont of Epithemia clementina EcSB]